MAFVSTADVLGRRFVRPSRAAVAARPTGIAHVVNSDRWGGMEARTLETAEWQTRKGLRTCIVTSPEGPLLQEARHRGVTAVPFDFDGRDRLAGLRAMRSLFRAQEVGFADFHTNRSYALGVRDLATLVRTQHVLRPAKSGQLRVNREFPFDGFILSSHAGGQALVQRGYARSSRVSIVGEWAPERFFGPTPTPAERALRRTRLGLPADAPVIGAVAMLRPDNAFDALIRATALLHARGVAAHCLVIGSSMHIEPRPCAQERALSGLAEELGVASHVHFLGYRTDVPELLDVMDVAAIVSRHTAQTRVAPEAAARGRPVVAFDVGALHETLIDGRSGLLAPAGDALAFTDALERLLRDPDSRLRLGEEAARLAHGSFRQAHKMEETLEVYRRAAELRPIAPRAFATHAASALYAEAA